METILVSLRAGETHSPEHDIEEMVAGTAVQDVEHEIRELLGEEEHAD